MLVSRLNKSAIALGIFNVTAAILGFSLFIILSFPTSFDDRRDIPKFPFVAVSLAAALRLFVMIRTGIAQQAVAMLIRGNPRKDDRLEESVVREQRRLGYKRWLWWTRFATLITVLQFVGAVYLVFNVVKGSRGWLSGLDSSSDKQKEIVLVVFIINACAVAIAQIFAGPDILKWRSFYEKEGIAWKAHYREVFDYGIREVLCCLGRVKYLSALEEDEVYSVAQLLGDLVAYRASGTGHLELLAGLALLQRSQTSNSNEGLVEAPNEQIREASFFHKFAEAAYTGPLLDFGRNPVLFPCAWLYRQGILTPWNCNRRPRLDGDNWWRGHAAAFLKYVNLSHDTLRRGRVCQAKREAAYFVVVLHGIRTVVIAVRGTETPEDLITDGLCSECKLSVEDLDGLLNCSNIHPAIKQRINLTSPHYGHSGIVTAARDLYMEIEGKPEHDGMGSRGFLSALLGSGCECDGYSVRIVGHSLGGSIAALLGIQLYNRFPNLHVYSFGPLPCVDSVIASACSNFVTSVIYDNEFSARLSVGSVLRLRAAAIMALSQDRKAESAIIFRLAQRFLYLNKNQESKPADDGPALKTFSWSESAEHASCHNYEILHDNNNGGLKDIDQNIYLWNEPRRKDNIMEINDGDNEFLNPFFGNSGNMNSPGDPVSQFMETVPSHEKRLPGDPPEVFLPGNIIHIVPEKKSFHLAFWRNWKVEERAESYRAYIAERESFRDMIVSPSMFLDHLPWRCHSAMEAILKD